MSKVKSLCLLLIIVFSSVFCGCSSSPAELAQVEHYREFVDRINYESTPEFKFNSTIDRWIIAQPNLKMTSKSLYDDAKLVNGDYQIVTIGDKQYLDNLSGDVIDIDNLIGEKFDINNKSDIFAYDKFLTEVGGKYGLSDIHGNVILENKFSSIEYKFDLVKAVDDRGCYVYKSGKLRATVDCNQAKYIELFDNNIIKFNGIMCDIGLNELFVEYYDRQYRVVDYHDSQYIIEDKRGKLGYYDTRDKFIEPRFDNISFFGSNASDSVTIATNNGTSFVIDYDGEIIYTDSGTLFDNYFDGYYFARINGEDSILDKNFQAISLPSSLILTYNRAYDNNVIIDTEYGMTFYNLLSNEYSLNKFMSIEPIKFNYFICKNFDGTYALLDRNLTVVFDYFQEIEFFDKYLKIKVLDIYKILTIDN